MLSMKDYLETGKIVNTHGVRGDMTAQAWCDDVSAFCDFDCLFILRGNNYIKYRITKCSKYKENVLLHLDGIETREEAQALKNSTLYVERSMIKLPDDRVLCADIIGLDAIDAETGRVYGRIADVSDGVASQYYEIKTPDGKLCLMPAIKEFIARAVPGEAVYITPPEGLFNEI